MSSNLNSFHYEQRVLENLMHFGSHTHRRVQEAMLKLKCELFQNYSNAKIFGIITDLFHNERGFNFVDVMTCIGPRAPEVHEQLEWIITNYTTMHVNESSFESDVTKLNTISILNEQRKLAGDMIEDFDNCLVIEDCKKILKSSLEEIYNLNYAESQQGTDNLELAQAYGDGLIVADLKIPTTCNTLNEALQDGIMPKSLIIVAAGASVGKTGFAIAMLDWIARAQPGTQSLFFSIEMESKHIFTRHVGICGGKQFDKLSGQEQFQAIAKSIEVPIKIYDTANCRKCADIDFIVTTARLRALDKPISVIVVDYLGLVQTTKVFERNDLKQSDITSKLAQLAIELNCTVIALSQINRGNATRASDDRCPWPHDAADSSGGHRSSSLWLGVDRPELYQDDSHFKNQFVVKCRKNRFGDTFEIMFAFNDGTFGEVSQDYFRKPYKAKLNPSEALFGAQG